LDLSTAVKGYFDTRERLTKQWGNKEAIADILFKMATYLTYISDELGNLKEQYELQRASKYLQYIKTNSDNKSQNLARTDLAEIKGQIEKLEIMNKSGWSLVNTGQTRLKNLNDEQRTGGLTT
jgi:hypothetical protein